MSRRRSRWAAASSCAGAWALGLIVAAVAVVTTAGCAGVTPSTGAGGQDGGGVGGHGGAGGRGGTGGALPLDGPPGGGERAPDFQTAEVFAHSDDTLYVLDPLTKQVRRVGMFDCFDGAMFDIAIDRDGRMTGSIVGFDDVSGAAVGALLSIDRNTARCTVLSRFPGLPPSSLTYVPAGTLLPNDEALVGYDEDRYVRVDPATGALTVIGMLNNEPASGGTHWVSSGDIVSINNGGTYLTVTDDLMTGDDRIVEVNPRTGALVRIIGALGVKAVLGLGYWAGVAYGFSLEGELLQIDLRNGATTRIPIPNPDPGLTFLGAGTTTSAPIVP